MRRLWLLALALGAAVVCVPSASFARAQLASMSGTITRVPGGIRVSIRNDGPDKAVYIRIRLAEGVHHTGAQTTGLGGGCGAGPDASTVTCGYGLPSQGFLPGEAREITITTDKAYPAGAGAQISSAPAAAGPFEPAGTATGPPEQPCTCKSLTAKIGPRSIRITSTNVLGQPATKLAFTLHWALKCTAGDGECEGTLAAVPPRTAAYVSLLAKPPKPVSCDADCAETETGRSAHVMALAVRGRKGEGRRLDDDDFAAIGRLPLTIKRTCGARTLPALRLSLAFDRTTGDLVLKRSRLG